MVSLYSLLSFARLLYLHTRLHISVMRPGYTETRQSTGVEVEVEETIHANIEQQV